MAAQNTFREMGDLMKPPRNGVRLRHNGEGNGRAPNTPNDAKHAPLWNVLDVKTLGTSSPTHLYGGGVAEHVGQRLDRHGPQRQL
jgi:hypothetical protein